MNRVWLGLILAGAVSLAGSSALAASVQGRIKGHQHLRNPVWTEAKSVERHGYSFRESVPTVPSSLRKLFPDASREICIVAFSGDKQAPSRKPIAIRVAGGRTSAVTLVVEPGSEVRFTNGDSFVHRLFGVGLSTFAPAPLAPGKSRRWPVKNSGKYEIADEVAPSVRMWIVAKSGVAAIAYPTSKGKFSLELDSGTYTLQAYFAGEPIGKSRRVKVGRRRVNLSRRPLILATKAPKESDPSR